MRGSFILMLAFVVTIITARGATAGELKLVPDDWREIDTKRQVAYTVIAIMDAGTTADIRNHDDIEEKAPITRQVLGRNPEPTETALYFTGMAIGNYVVSAVLPPKYRSYWQNTTIIVNGGIVANNYRIGLRWGF